MARKALIKTVAFNSFAKLYAALMPGGMYGAKRHDLYRGVSDARHKLISSALRKQRHGSCCEGDCMDDEMKTFIHFYTEANRQGLPLPECDQSFKAFFLEPINRNLTVDKWYPEAGVEALAALAQHHLVPTRMLDWSYSVHCALYFMTMKACFKAARKQYKGGIKNKLMAVWRLSSVSYSEQLEELAFRTVVPSYAGNPNLQAQQGVLTYLRIDDPSEKINCLPLDQYFKQKITDIRDTPLLMKFTLPVEGCFAGLWFLHVLGHTGATYFPGYAGVAKYVEERDLIHKHA